MAALGSPLSVSGIARVREHARETTHRETHAALVLSDLPGIGPLGFRTVVDHFGSARAALRSPVALGALWPRADVAGATRRMAAERAERLFEHTSRLGLALRTYGSANYPAGLTHLHDPPPLLWIRGDSRLLESEPSCTVVGSRRASPYGLRVAESLGHRLAAAGVPVISGMALGIDGAVHRGALSAEGGTVAVLGSGADVPTPRTHRRLYQQIVEFGAVVSEFAPGTPAAPQNFPRRNRILAGLATVVAVVEANRKSGALITVDHALDLGRTVFAVPGPIESHRSEGTNALLADGASVLTSADALVEVLVGGCGPAERSPAPPARLGGTATAVWHLLGEGPLSFDSVTAELDRTADEVLAALGILELEGWIVAEPGARYARKASYRSLDLGR